MRHFKVLHLGAGRWSKDAVISEQEIVNGGFDLDAWLRDGAVSETQPPNQAAAGQSQAASQARRPAGAQAAVAPPTVSAGTSAAPSSTTSDRDFELNKPNGAKT